MVMDMAMVMDMMDMVTMDTTVRDQPMLRLLLLPGQDMAMVMDMVMDMDMAMDMVDMVDMVIMDTTVRDQLMLKQPLLLSQDMAMVMDMDMVMDMVMVMVMDTMVKYVESSNASELEVDSVMSLVMKHKIK